MDDSLTKLREPAAPPGSAPVVALPGPLRRWLFLAVGFIFVGLAVLGVLLPVLPTTPFVLLASCCFVRSSPRLNQWLLGTRLFGPLLRDWQRHRGVRRHVKVTAVSVMGLAVAGSATLGDLSWPWLAGLILLALIGLTVVLRLPEVGAPGDIAPVPDTERSEDNYG